MSSLLDKDPRLTGNLLGILLRFWEERVAFSPYRSSCQRKLPISITFFGEISTPQRTNDIRPATSHVRRQAASRYSEFRDAEVAKETEKEFSKAATTLKHDRYVDDLIHFYPDTSQAEKSAT